MVTELSRPGIYTPSAPGLPEDALRAELEQLQALTAAQIETILAYAATYGQLVSVTPRPSHMARGWAVFETLEAATGITYQDRLERCGRAWFAGRSQRLMQR